MVVATASIHRSAGAPRPCFRCHETKPADEFDFGPSGRRRRAVCRDCAAADEAAKQQREAGWRATFVDPQTGRTVRRCSRCRDVFPLTAKHFTSYRDGGRRRFHSACRSCERDRLKALREERLRDPEQRRLQREKNREWQRRWREQNPERARTLSRESQARARRRAKGEPVPSAQPDPRAPTDLSRVPSLPLFRLVEARRMRLGLRDQDVAEMYGLSERMVNRWRAYATPRTVSTGVDGGMVALGVVDRVCCRSGWLWFDIYPEGAPGHERAREFFEPGCEDAA